MINLSQVIANGGITHYLSELKNRKLLISDFPIEGEKISSGNIKYLQLNSSTSLKEILKELKNPQEEILIMSTHLGVEQWIPILKELESYTFINCFTGIGSFGKKHAPELDDLSILKENNLTPLVFFPSDEEAFVYALKKDSKQKYLRLCNNYLALNKYQWNESDEMEEIGFIEQKLVGNHYLLPLKEQTRAQVTIIFTGELFAQAVTVQALAEEEEKNRDIFVVDIFEKEQIQEKIQRSLKQSKNLLLVSDQTPQSAKLLAAEYLDTNCSFTALSPSYDQLSTLLEDYQYQQAGFEGLEIYQKLSQLLG